MAAATNFQVVPAKSQAPTAYTLMGMQIRYEAPLRGRVQRERINGKRLTCLPLQRREKEQTRRDWWRLVAAAQVAGVVAADGCGGDCLWCSEEQERGWGRLMAATR